MAERQERKYFSGNSCCWIYEITIFFSQGSSLCGAAEAVSGRGWGIGAAKD
jgi:hypothetical protein